MTKEKPTKEDYEDSTVKTVYKAETNNWAIRLYNCLKFKFIIIVFIYTPVCVCNQIPKRVECDMISSHVLNLMYAKNSSTVVLKPVNGT